MIYWMRTREIAIPAMYLLMGVLWSIGGWMIVSHAFAVKRRERLICGFATGFVLFISVGNLLANVMQLTLAYWIATLLIFVSGVLLMVRSTSRPRLDLHDLNSWPIAFVGLGTAWVFTLVLRGLAIFDDYYHLPLVSTMAAGNIPPVYQLDPSQRLPYHYALQVFAASLVRLGGLLPWSAWDLSRGIALGLTFVLGWLWVRRVTWSRAAAWIGSGLFIFGGGARWLLLFVSPDLLTKFGTGLQLDDTGRRAGTDLALALTHAWPMEGAGPLPFPYAYANGIFRSWSMALGTSGALPALTILLLLLLWGRRRITTPGMVVLGLLLADLALSAEHLFAVVLGGAGLVLMVQLVRTRLRHLPLDRSFLGRSLVVLAIGLGLALIQGGFITEFARDLIVRITGGTQSIVSTDYQGFSLRASPAIPSGHFGPLSLLIPGQLVVLLAELGPVLLLAPAVVLLFVRKVAGKDMLFASLAAGSVVSFLFPIFFRYGLDFNITRLTGGALWLWSVVAFPALWGWMLSGRVGVRSMAWAGYAVTVFGGVVLFGIELIAIPSPVLSTFVNNTDARYARAYWDKLAPGAQVLDSTPERAVTLFGRASRAMMDVYHPWPDWTALITDPDPKSVADAGYSYIYEDEQWWRSMTGEQHQALRASCVKDMTIEYVKKDEFPRLLDVRGCK
jgi:hypothetical protein